jgi:hypothetical protein
MSTLKIIGYGRLVENVKPLFLKNFNYENFRPNNIENWSVEQFEIFRIDQGKGIVIGSSAPTYELAVFKINHFKSIFFCERYNGILFPPYLDDTAKAQYLKELFDIGVFESTAHYQTYHSFTKPLIIEDSLRYKKFTDSVLFDNKTPEISI